MMDNLIISALASLGLTAIIFISVWLFVGVAMNESQDTLNRTFAAIGSTILFIAFWYLIVTTVVK